MTVSPLRSVPAAPEPTRLLDKNIQRRREAGNKRLNEAQRSGDPIAVVQALALNLTSAMRLIRADQQKDLAGRVAGLMGEATNAAYRTARSNQKGEGA